MSNKTLSLIIGEKEYHAKATLGLYSRAGEASGYDISDIFSAVMPPRAFFIALAAEVAGMDFRQLEDTLFMKEYLGLCNAVVAAVLPEVAQVDDGPKNPTTPEIPSP